MTGESVPQGVDDQAWEGVPSVLLISDDMTWTAPVEQALRVDGFAVAVARDAAEAAAVSDELDPDVAIVDAGTEERVAMVCREVRAGTGALLFAIGREESDVLGATTAGADAYVVRSSSPRVIVARVRALLRRSGRAAREPKPFEPFEALVVGGRRVVVDSGVGRDERYLAVDPTSFTILAALLRRPGAVVSRTRLLFDLGIAPSAGSSLDIAVRRLREQIEPHTRCRCVVAVRGVGFRYVCPRPVDLTRIEGPDRAASAPTVTLVRVT